MNYAISFLLILVPLVVIHELGHFLMAKLGGIHVTKFAVGFGKKIFGFHFKGTEYCWNILPLGGYVDFMGELVYTNQIPKDAAHFYNRPKWIRLLVMLMGPLFNLILAFVLFAFIYSMTPVREAIYFGEAYTVGEVAADSPEALAGLQIHDRIVAIDGSAINSYDDVPLMLLFNPGKEVQLSIVRQSQELSISYNVPVDEKEGVGTLNFAPFSRTMVAAIVEASPAAEAGLREGDLITHINGTLLPNLIQGENIISRLVSEVAPKPSRLTLERGGEVVEIEVTPRMEQDRWLLGFSYSAEASWIQLNWKQALVRSWDSCIINSTLIYKALHSLIRGALPIKTLSGPIGVGVAAKRAMDYGIWPFLYLMAIISLNLGIMNMLPIPVLDGGEIFVLLVEWVSRNDFSLMTKMKIKMVGFVFLVGLICIIMVTDVIKAI